MDSGRCLGCNVTNQISKSHLRSSSFVRSFVRSFGRWRPKESSNVRRSTTTTTTTTNNERRTTTTTTIDNERRRTTTNDERRRTTTTNDDERPLLDALGFFLSGLLPSLISECNDRPSLSYCQRPSSVYLLCHT